MPQWVLERERERSLGGDEIYKYLKEEEEEEGAEERAEGSVIM